MISRESPALAIILARAGSKGVPGKNALVIAGKPCVVWTIDACRASRRIGAMAVSTDGAAIGDAARAAGCEVLPRPADLAGDKVTVDASARQAVSAWESLHSRLGDDAPVVLLYGNVPIRPAGLIDRAVELLTSTRCDSVQSYAGVGKYHPWWTVRVDEASGVVKPWEGDVLYHNVFRRQDLPPAQVPDGGVLVVSRRALMLEIAGAGSGPHQFLGVDRRGIVNAEGSVVDIDSAIDVHVASAILLEQQSKKAMGGA